MELSRASLRRRIPSFAGVLMFLSIFGPGVITASVDNDAGGITTYSIAGAHFGYSLLWTLIPITISLFVVQEMCARMGVVTGKGLADLIRETFGVKPTVFLLIGLIIANLTTTTAEFAGIAASMEIFGVSKYLSVPVAAALVWLVIVKGNYRSIEKIFLITSGFYITYIISGLLLHPSWGFLLKQTLTPSLDLRSDYLYMLIGVIGTTITPWMQFYLQSSVVEKGVKVSEYKYTRWDVYLGGIITDVVSYFIIFTCAASIFANGMRIETAKDAALALFPLAGQYSAWLFALGLLNASIFAASVLPLSTSYFLCEGMGWDSGLNKQFWEAPQFYALYTMLIAIGACIILIPDAPLLTIMVLSQVVNGSLLPFVLVFILLLINNRKLMGSYTNSKLFNVIAWATTVILSLLTVMLVITTIFPGLVP
ncbi:MAG TPA: Nramp family divalent metal transporter [Methanotrichaceae archaeon]|nr:Nramp family divalent metal transporter [Methanotrichaceae archaeon]